MTYVHIVRFFKHREPYLKLLYVTPERLVNHLGFKDRLLALYNNEMLARFVIDEAHCVSSWGHDFRKDYKGVRTESPPFIIRYDNSNCSF